jgi:hypothetical protein
MISQITLAVPSSPEKKLYKITVLEIKENVVLQKIFLFNRMHAGHRLKLIEMRPAIFVHMG